MASLTTGGRLAKLRKENLPLVVALQGLGFFLLAFFIIAPANNHDMEDSAIGSGWLTDNSPVRLADTQIPADLSPEQLRLPRFPDPKERILERQPVPSGEESEDSLGAIGFMDSLRVDTVAVHSPAVVQVALTLPDAPDELAPGTISLTRFGDGTGRAGLAGRRGRGGIGGFGGIGMGDGPRCHPRRPGVLRNPRNPITGPPPIIDRVSETRWR
jgi:hypothetical protein